MDGIANQIDPGDPNLENMYARPLHEVLATGTQILPQSLLEALSELQQDEVIQAALGPVAEEFINVKTQEWEEYDSQVSSWEIDQYLTFF